MARMPYLAHGSIVRLVQTCKSPKKIYILRGVITSLGMQSYPERICLWKTHALFIGRLPEFGPRRQAAAALCIGLEDDIEISADEQSWFRCRTALTGPEIHHAIRFGGKPCALIFLEPNTADYARIRSTNAQREQAGIFTALAQEAYLLDFLREVNRCENAVALQDVLNSFSLGANDPVPQQLPDARMQKIALQVARESADNIPIAELAQSLAMSVSSLEHLFKKEIGVPIRMFRIWFRLKAAVLYLKEGLSLTDAALRAGFYDSAHFTRTFKDVFGLPPSEIFNAHRRLQWHVAADAYTTNATALNDLRSDM